MISELRTIDADSLWMSPAYGRPSLAIHFTWIPDLPAVVPAVAAVEEALEPFEPRPHWGKVFTIPAEAVAARYPRLGRFRALARELDRDRRFSNPMVDKYVLGELQAGEANHG